MAKATYNPIARQYEEDILDGRIPSCQLLQKAIRRHRRDLREGSKRGLRFIHEKGQAILDFCELVNLEPQTPIHLMPFQVWELYVFYGWYRTDGTRRFRTKYKSCARGNGKTPQEAVEHLYHILVDGPQNAEAYVAANKEKQAEICFNDVAQILRHSPELSEELGITATTVFHVERNSKFGFLTSNPTTADGTRPTRATIDEYHEFEDDKMVEVLSSGLIKKPNSILSYITTRGTHKDYPCAVFEKKVAIPILEGSIQNDDIFVVIYTQDDEKEFDQPHTWIKSNPMLAPGGVLRLDTLKREREEKILKGEESIAAFMTKNLNLWVDAPKTFIPEKLWLASGSRWDESELERRQCWAGLDMSATNDFSSLSLVFPPADWGAHDEEYTEEELAKSLYIRSGLRMPGPFRVIWRYWIPEYKFEKRIADGMAQLRDWRAAGLIRFVDGNVIDPRLVEEEVRVLLQTFDIKRLAYDRYNATSTALSIQTMGVPVVEFPQTPYFYTKPTGDFRDLVLKKRLDHGGNPVSTWMMRNAVPKVVDDAGNIMLSKKRSPEKIDGIIAGIMGLGAWMSDREATSNRSRYEEDDAEVFYLD